MRASVVDFSLKDQDPPSPGLYWPWKWATVRLQVHERLKGNPTDTIVFVIGIPNGLSTLDDWKKSKAKMIWLLNPHDPKVDRTPIPEGATADERKWRPRQGRGLGAAVLEPGARVFTIDGKEDSTVLLGGVDLPSRKTARVRLGSDLGGGREFSGLIGSIMVYGRPLSAQEVMQLYMGTKGRFK